MNVVPPLHGRRGWVAWSIVAGLAACASQPAWTPGELTPAQWEKCKALEVAYRGQAPEHPTLRDELAKDPVASAYYVRMLIRDVFLVREGRPLGESEDLLLAAAKVKDPVEVRAFAEVKALGAAAVPTVVGYLLRHPQALEREVGIELIGQIGPAAVPALRELAHDAEARHRRVAARALAAASTGSDVFEALAGLAKDDDFKVRADAMRGLQVAGGAEAAALLRERLRDDADPFVRQKAAQALVAHPERETGLALVDYLERCIREKDSPGERIGQASLKALAGATGPRTVSAWRTWASSWRPARLAPPPPVPANQPPR